MKGKFGVSKFDEAKFYECKATLSARVQNLNLHHDAKFMESLNAYVDQLHSEGMSIHRDRTADEIAAGQQRADRLVEEFRHRHGFQVSYDWWRAHNEDDDFRDKRIHEAESNSAHGYLWSKSEVEPAAKVAAKDGGLPLEKTVAGALMDKLSWGFDDWAASPTMGRLWEQLSVAFVEGFQGWANAVVLGGVVESSVLTRLEWPHLRKKIEDGSVLGIRVRVMRLAGDPRDSRTWSLETTAGFDVKSQEEFDSLPRPSGPEFWGRQKRWHDRQMANAGKSYDRVGANVSQYSLRNFHEVFDDPTLTVTLSGLEGDRWDSGVLTESPKQLSRAATYGSLKRATTMSSVETSGTSDSLESSSEGDLSLSTLNLKLAVIQEEEAAESHETERLPVEPRSHIERSDSLTEAYVSSLVSGVQEYAPPSGAGVQPAPGQSAQPHHGSLPLKENQQKFNAGDQNRRSR
ncbi:hypothetical protein ABTZ59_12490 [Streptomyces sp. NPDC094034]|uniref:hypothetical protein n=1 Tax=Streptomyces sp. NPDC094034 TaxID=3155309 RepID=UPI00331E3274